MNPTDILRELAKIAKQQGNQRLVRIYFQNMKMHRRKRMAQMDRDSKCAVG